MKKLLLLIGLLLCGCTPPAPAEPSNTVIFEDIPAGNYCEEATVNVNTQSWKTWDKSQPKPSILCWMPSDNYGDHCKVIGYGKCTKFVTSPRRCFIIFQTGLRQEIDCPPAK